MKAKQNGRKNFQRNKKVWFDLALAFFNVWAPGKVEKAGRNQAQLLNQDKLYSKDIVRVRYLGY